MSIALSTDVYVQIHAAAMPKTHITICKMLVTVNNDAFLVIKRHNDGNAKPTRQPPRDPPTPRIGLISGRRMARRTFTMLTIGMRISLCLVNIVSGISSFQSIWPIEPTIDRTIAGYEALTLMKSPILTKMNKISSGGNDSRISDFVSLPKSR